MGSADKHRLVLLGSPKLRRVAAETPNSMGYVAIEGSLAELSEEDVAS